MTFAGNLFKNWYAEFDLQIGIWDSGWGFGIQDKLLNSMTELFLNKKQCIYQWIWDIQIIWKLSYINLLEIIVFELFEHRTKLIVFFFLVMILIIWLIMKPNSFKENFILTFLKNMIKPPFLRKGSCKISPIHPFCLSVCMWHIFHYSVDFLNFFCMRVFCHAYYKVTYPDFQ